MNSLMLFQINVLAHVLKHQEVFYVIIVNGPENSLIKKYAPLMFKIRSNLLFDRKDIVRKDINDLINSLSFGNF